MPGSTPQPADVGLARLDGQGRCVYVNERLCEIVGWPRQAVLERGWVKLMPAQIASQLSDLWREIRAGRSIRSVSSHERADGRRISIQFEAMPEIGADGRVASILVSCVDAAHQTASDVEARSRQQAFARLEELEELYHRTPVGLCVVDRALRYVRANDTYAQTVGCRIEDLIGRSMREVIPESAREEAIAVAKRVMETGQPVRGLELRRAVPGHPDRAIVWLANIHPVERDGAVVGSMAVLQDVTELRRAEEAAARRLEELEILYAATPAGLCYLDPALRIVHLNPLFAQLSGLPAPELVGRPVGEVLPEVFAQRIVPQLRYVARTGAPSVDLEIRGPLPGAGPRHYTWIARVHPVKSRAGEITGVITVWKDVTAMADRQREIEAVRDRLAEAQRVARVGSWEWNLIEDRVWWSPELYEIFGADPSREASYTRFFEHVHPADRPKVRDQIERTLGDDQPYRMTFRILRGDGAERLVFTAARLERNPGGLAMRLVGTCQDVTEFGPFDAAGRSPRPPASG